MFTDNNDKWKVQVYGDATAGYKVYAVSPHGVKAPLEFSYLELHMSGKGEFSEAVVYFPHPVVDVEVPRAADGVRAG